MAEWPADAPGAVEDEMITCATCGAALGHIDAACENCLPGFGRERPWRNPVADARENAVKDILAMSQWSEAMQDDIVQTSLIRDYLAELVRLR